MSPSSTTTVDSIERLVVDGPALSVPGATRGSTLDCSWKITMRTLPPSPICGRSRSVSPTSRRSMVWNGLAAAPPAGGRNWPVMNGTLAPTTMRASSLSRVIRLGAETMLASVWVCSRRAMADRP